MQPAQTTQTQQKQTDRVSRVGGWLFRQRTWLPLPIIAALLLLPGPRASTIVAFAGIVTVVAGEAIRVWAVRHIGVISRTRSDRLGPLVMAGPFALVRNPLYIGNLLLWVGFTISAGLLWLVPLVVVILGAEYYAIVRWEEGLLEERLGESYRAYAAQVGRWAPRSLRSQVTSLKSPETGGRLFSWRDTFFSERGTIVAIVVGYVLLFVKFTVQM